MWLLIELPLFVFEVIVSFMVGYLLLLTMAAFWSKKETEIQNLPHQIRFAILIPAHNEEQILPDLFQSLKNLDYPSDLVDIYTVADNCTDDTALIARSYGAIVHTRNVPQSPGKGPALQWLLQKVWQGDRSPDAVVIVDADSIFSPGFLKVMAARIENGEEVIQAYYSVRAPETAAGAIRYAALAVLHYLRSQGRMTLGGSAGLKGNGMVFTNDILKHHEWSSSITEDIELHMSLILDGVRVTFAPDAVVLGEMPDTLVNSKTQHARWERGRLDMSRRYIPLLLKQMWRKITAGESKRTFVFFDAVMEHLIPPFSILFVWSGFLLLVNLILIAIKNLLGGNNLTTFDPGITEWGLVLILGALLGQVAYLFAGLLSIRAPGFVYRSLLFAPVYIAWKSVQYIQAVVGKGDNAWVRTRRNER